MSNGLIIYERMNEMQTAAQAMHASGYFSDVKTQQQAMVKVMAGAEIGLPPFASMTGIHIVQGKPVIGANLIATLVKNDPRYDYRVKQADDTACVIVWYEKGQVVGESSFTRKEAADGNVDKSWDKEKSTWKEKPTWKAFPSDMLFARAISRGARRYAPGIFGGSPVYTPDEMGVETDEDGAIIPGEIVTVTPAPVKPAAQPVTNDDGPLPDDEMTVYEAPAADFLKVTAALLESDAGDLKAHLKALGYSGVPGVPEKRLAAYRALKAAQFVVNPDDHDARADDAHDEPLFPLPAVDPA